MRKSRRDFLKEIGAASVLLPTLPSLLLSREAQAAGTPPKRLAIFYSYNGVHDSVFWPSVSPTTQAASGVYSMKISDIIVQKGQTSNVIGPAFNSLAGKFSVVSGLGQYISPYADTFIVHEGASVLSLAHISAPSDDAGFDAPKCGSSLDCIVENSTGFYAVKPKLSAIRLYGGNPKWDVSFWRPTGGATPRNQVQRMQYLDGNNARTIYNAVFGSSASPVATPTPAPGGYRGKVFETILSQFSALKNSAALSTADKERLDTHTQFLAQVRDSVVGSGGGGGGGGGGTPTQCSPNQLLSGTDVLSTHNNNMSTIAAAFACDLSRVSVYLLNNYDDSGKIVWDYDHYNSHEETSNLQAKGLSTNFTANCTAWKGWQANRIADFMNKLNQIKEADGSTVLDNTIVLWVNQHGGTHRTTNYPILVGGGAAGQFRMGEYIDYRSNRKDSESIGRPLSNLWMSIMRSLGVPAADYLKQGEGGFYGQIPDSTYMAVNGYPSNIDAIRKELIPYFYTGPA